MTRLKSIFVGAGLLALSCLPAFAQQGAFPNYPIVGGAAYCSSTTNGVCTNTVPAGPTIITGNEQLPANTELPNGTSPQNVLITPKSLNALPFNFLDVSANTQLATALVSASNISGGVIFISGSTITSGNVTLPAAPIAGQEFRISSSVSITNLKIAVDPSSTATISNAPTGLTISTTGSYGYAFRYYRAGTKWYRIL